MTPRRAPSCGDVPPSMRAPPPWHARPPRRFGACWRHAQRLPVAAPTPWATRGHRCPAPTRLPICWATPRPHLHRQHARLTTPCRPPRVGPGVRPNRRSIPSTRRSRQPPVSPPRPRPGRLRRACPGAPCCPTISTCSHSLCQPPPRRRRRRRRQRHLLAAAHSMTSFRVPRRLRSTSGSGFSAATAIRWRTSWPTWRLPALRGGTRSRIHARIMAPLTARITARVKAQSKPPCRPTRWHCSALRQPIRCRMTACRRRLTTCRSCAPRSCHRPCGRGLRRRPR